VHGWGNGSLVVALAGRNSAGRLAFYRQAARCHVNRCRYTSRPTGADTVDDAADEKAPVISHVIYNGGLYSPISIQHSARNASRQGYCVLFGRQPLLRHSVCLLSVCLAVTYVLWLNGTSYQKRFWRTIATAGRFGWPLRVWWWWWWKYGTSNICIANYGQTASVSGMVTTDILINRLQTFANVLSNASIADPLIPQTGYLTDPSSTFASLWTPAYGRPFCSDSWTSCLTQLTRASDTRIRLVRTEVRLRSRRSLLLMSWQSGREHLPTSIISACQKCFSKNTVAGSPQFG